MVAELPDREPLDSLDKTEDEGGSFSFAAERSVPAPTPASQVTLAGSDPDPALSEFEELVRQSREKEEQAPQAATRMPDLTGDPEIDGLVTEQARSRKIAENKAFLESRKAQLKKELDDRFGPQTPAVPYEEDFTGGEMVRGIGRIGWSAIPSNTGYYLQQVAGAIDMAKPGSEEAGEFNKKVAKYLRETGQSLADWGEWAGRKIPAQGQDFKEIRTGAGIGPFAHDLWRWSQAKIGETAMFGAPILAAGWALGGVGLLGTSVPMGVGEVRQALEQEGIDDEKALQSYGWTAGIAIGALDAIVPYDILNGPGGDNLKRGLMKYMLVRMAKAGGGVMTEEAFTEAFQEAIKIAAVAEATGLHVGEDRQSEAIYNMGRDLFEKRWEILEAGAAGAIGGLTLGAGKIASAAAPVREAKARTGGTKTDVTPAPAVAQPKEEPEKPEEAKPADSYDVKQFYPAEEFGRESDEGGTAPERPSAPAEQGAELRDVPLADKVEAVKQELEPTRIAAMAVKKTPEFEPWQQKLADTLAEMAKPLTPERVAELDQDVETNLPTYTSAIKDVYAERKLPFALPEQDVRAVARHMAQGLNAEEALERYAAEAYDRERTTRAAQAQAAQGDAGRGAEARQQAPGGQAAQAGAGAGPAPPAAPGTRPGGPAATGVGSLGARLQSQAAARGTGQPQRGVQQAQASPAERDYQRALRARFRSIVASKRPIKEWGKALNIKPAELKALVDEAVRDGLLRVDKNGVVRRTKLARVTPAATPTRPVEDVVAIPPDLRAAEAIRRREAETGKVIAPDVRRWAQSIEEARGNNKQFVELWNLLRAASRSGDLSLTDLRDLAAMVGYREVDARVGEKPATFASQAEARSAARKAMGAKASEGKAFYTYTEGGKWGWAQGASAAKTKKIPLSKMSKAGAIAAIKARHDDAVKAQKAQADRRNLGVELASIKGAREDGQEQKRELDKLGFYSKALEAAKALKQAKGTPEQMLAMLKSAGVKEAEIKATGLDKFLEGLGRETASPGTAGERPSSPDRPGSEGTSTPSEGRSPSAKKTQVSRQEIISFLTQNRVEVREVVYGAPGLDALDRQLEPINAERRRLNAEQRIENERRPSSLRDVLRGSAETRRIQERFAELDRQEQAIREDWASTKGRLTKWSQYSLDPSNPTYRESVIHLGQPKAVETAKARLKEIDDKLNLMSRKQWPDLVAALEAERRELLEKVPSDLSRFAQGHFEELDVIAHARTSLQKDKDGKVVFVVDELQSDWGQKLRDGGVRDEAKIAELEKQLGELQASARTLKREAADAFGVRMDEGGGVLNETGWLQSLSDRLTDKTSPVAVRVHEFANRSRLLDAELRTAKAATPGHPLVNTTDQWTQTAFRRLIRQAVEAGAERIAIVPGKVQAERFNLADQVSAVRYVPTAKAVQFIKRGTGGRDAWQRFRGAEGDDVTPETLASVIGKEAAEKVLAQPLTDIGDGHKAHVVEFPDGAVIGGEGMKATYDSIYPRTLGKLLKKIDPTVAQTDIELRSSLDGRTFLPKGNEAAEGYLTETRGDVGAALALATDYRNSLRSEPDTAQTDANVRIVDAAIASLKALKASGIQPILFHSFPLTQKVKDTVMGEGLALFSIQSRRSQKSLEEREAAARAEMQTPEWIAAGEKPADASLYTYNQPGYMSTPEWIINRRYVGKDGTEIKGVAAAVQYLAEQAADAVPGGVARERRAFLVIGYPGSGKSTIARALSKQYRAAHMVSDIPKDIIPEYDGGKNGEGVHEESSRLAKLATDELVSQGDNIIVETLGTWPKVAQRAAWFWSKGYTPSLVFIDTPKAVAMERAVERYHRSGRAVPVSRFDDLNPREAYDNAINDEAVLESARVTPTDDEQHWLVPDATGDFAQLADAIAEQVRQRAAGSGRPLAGSVDAQAGERRSPKGISERLGYPSESLPSLAARPFAPAFRSAIPQIGTAIEAELAQMVPDAAVATRVVDRLFDENGIALHELVTTPWQSQYRGDGFRWMLQVARDDVATMRAKGRHGVVHILRELGLWTDSEWQALVERAEKTGIRKAMEDDILTINKEKKSLWKLYEEMYAIAGSRAPEYMNQELVARLAEKYDAGTSYGKVIDGLLDRVAKFFIAIRNALRSVGITQLDHIFEPASEFVSDLAMRRMVSGEIRARPLPERDLSGRPIPRREPALDRTIDGRSARLYHGTHAEFDPTQIKPGSGIAGAIFAAQEPAFTEGFGSRVIPLDLQPGRYFDFRDPTQVKAALAAKPFSGEPGYVKVQERLVREGRWSAIENGPFRQWLEANGYDGAWLAHTYDDKKASKASDNIVVWIPGKLTAASSDRAEGRSLVDLVDTSHAQKLSRLQELIANVEGGEGLIASIKGSGEGPSIAPANARSGPDVSGDPRSAGIGRTPRSLMEIVVDLKDALGMTATQGLTELTVRDRATGRSTTIRPTRNVRAQYETGGGVARVRVVNEIDAIAHEGGHHIERLFGGDLRALMQEHADDLAKFGANVEMPADGDGVRSEQFAEFFREFVLNRDAADRLAPRLTEAFSDFLDVNGPGILEGLDNMEMAMLSKEYQDYLKASTTERAVADLVSEADRRFTTRMRDWLRQIGQHGTISGFASRVYEAGMDETHSFTLLVRKLLERADENGITDPQGRAISLAVHENPAKLMRSIGDSFKTGLRWIQDGMPNYRHADAGYRIEASDGRILRIVPTMADAQAALQTAGDGATIKPNAGVRSASLHDALSLAMGKKWSHGAYQRFGAYLESRRAVEEWKNWNAKQDRIAELEVALTEGAEQRRALADVAQKDRGRLQRASNAAERNRALLLDRRRALGREETRLEHIQKRLEEVSAALEEAQEAIDDGSDEARVRRARAERSQNLNERKQRIALRDVDALQDAFDELSTQAIILESVIEQRRDAYQASSAAVSQQDAVLNEVRRERNQTRERGLQRPPHRISQQEHEWRIADFEQANPQFRQAAEMVYDFLWQSAVHDFQAGRLSQAQLDYRATRKHYYVPFGRSMQDLEAAGLLATGRGLGGRSPTFSKDKAYRGSNRDVVNPIETIIDQTFHRAAATHKNDVVRAIAETADKVGPGGAAIAERVTRTEIIEANAAAFAALQRQIEGFGHTPEDAHEIVKRIEADYGDNQLFMQYTSKGTGPQAGLNLTLWENGERNVVRVNDPELAAMIFNSVNGVGRELSNLVIDMVAKPATLLRAGVTTNPAFFFPNLIRDMWSAWTLTGSLIDPRTWPGVTQIRGLGHEFLQTDMARLYQEVGGLMGGQNVAALSKVRDKADVMALREKGLQIKPLRLGASALAGGAAGFAVAGPAGAAFGALLGAGMHKGPQHFFETVAQMADMSETATRLGVFTYAYKAALAYNPSLTPYQAAQEAAFVARDLIDFGRRGSKMLAAARLVPFLNANLQGLDKAQRALLAQSDRGKGISVTKLVGLMASGAGAGFAVGGPVGAAVGTFAAPAVATKFAARMTAARALLTPFTKRDAGLPISADEQRAMATSAKAWVNLLLYTAILVAFAWWYKDDDEYKMINERLKYKAQPIKGPDGEWHPIPKAFEWAIPSNIIEAAIDAQYGRDPRFWERVGAGLVDVLAPPAVPQAVRLWRDIGANYDSLGKKPIVPEYMRTDAPEEQFGAYASQFAISLSRAVNSRPWLKTGVEKTGSALFQNQFELTPAIVDYALRTSLGYWGKDAQKASNTMRPSGPISEKIVEFPLIGTALQRFQLDPYRTSDAIRAYYEEMGRFTDGYPRAARGYDTKLQRYGQRAGNQFLATLDEDKRAYALLEGSSSAGNKRLHPLNRLKDVIAVTGDIQRDILLERLADTSVKSDPTRIVLSPAKNDEVRDLMAKIAAIEANNSMVLMGHKQFAGRGYIDLQPTLDTLRASAPAVADEYENRLRRKKVRDFDEVRSTWPTLKADLLGRWQEQVDQDASERLEGAKRRRGVTKPTMPNAPNLPPLQLPVGPRIEMR